VEPVAAKAVWREKKLCGNWTFRTVNGAAKKPPNVSGSLAAPSKAQSAKKPTTFGGYANVGASKLTKAEKLGIKTNK